MERLLVLENIRRRRYLLLNMFRVKMDIIIIQQLIKILDNDVQGILLFSEFFSSSRVVAYSASNFSICVSGFSGFGRAFTPNSFRASLLAV